MHEIEGITKYQLDFEPCEIDLPDIELLKIWRSILHGLCLLGQHSDRYSGLAFGNVSQRCLANRQHFIISASQTGSLANLLPEHLAQVEHVDFVNMRVKAKGRLPPSSEAMSHAAIYALDSRINCVLHIHDPVMWHYALENQYPSTAKDVAYGTRQMADAIHELFVSADLAERRLLAMAGHQDGIIAFGKTVQDAGLRLLQLYVAAI